MRQEDPFEAGQGAHLKQSDSSANLFASRPSSPSTASLSSRGSWVDLAEEVSAWMIKTPGAPGGSNP